MPHRDPETGQFVSTETAGGDDWRDIEHVHGHRSWGIPAADLSGQSGASVQSEDEDAQIIDFDWLNSDEVFEVISGLFIATLEAHTTATAEGHVSAGVVFTETIAADEQDPVYQDPVFYQNSPTDFANTILDTVGVSRDGADGLLYGTRLGAEPSHSDTTNTLAAGSDYDRDRRLVPFEGLYGAGPAYDQDDELYSGVAINADNIDDHAIEVQTYASLRGRVHRLD